MFISVPRFTSKYDGAWRLSSPGARTLLARLWLEQDERHGGWALNQALRHLRSALGEVVSSRGDGEVDIDARYLACGAVDFEEAIEADDPEEERGKRLRSRRMMKERHAAVVARFRAAAAFPRD